MINTKNDVDIHYNFDYCNLSRIILYFNFDQVRY